MPQSPKSLPLTHRSCASDCSPCGGSTIRINRHRKQDRQYAVYFHCQTTLVDSFRGLFPKTFKFEGNRCIVFDEADRVPAAELKICIGMALTYHRKRARR
jgi:hypothetical protein